MRLFLALIFSVVQFFAVSASADSFYLDKDGKRYLCERVGDGGSGNCWDKCPYTFASCAESCGGGDQCWDKCPYTFGSCADTCGGGDRCWDKCPYTFNSCVESCGPKKNLPLNVLMRVMNSKLTPEDR